MPKNRRKPLRILTLDGGGMKGVLTAAMLVKLQEAYPRLLDEVDLVAGTSTGGILALGIADGRPPQDLLNLYLQRGEDIFDDDFWDNLIDLGTATGADYDGKGLRRVLRREFGRRRLRDLDKRVLIPAFDLNSGTSRHPAPWKPKFFHNVPGRDSDGNLEIVDVAMATSAAPTYFPSHQGYIDGGVVANNPSMAALACALDSRAHGAKLEDVVLLSLGTGAEPKFVKGRKLDWGWGQWARPLISVMISGTMGVAHFQCEQLLAGRYRRLDPVLDRGIDLDDTDPETLEYLHRRGAGVRTAATVSWLKRVGW